MLYYLIENSFIIAYKLLNFVFRNEIKKKNKLNVLQNLLKLINRIYLLKICELYLKILIDKFKN